MPDETPTFTPQEVFRNVNDPRFHQLPPAKRAFALNTMLDSAHNEMGREREWTPERQKAWGEFADHLQERAAPTFWEKAANVVTSLPGMITGMGKDVGVAAATSGDLVPGSPVNLYAHGEISKSFVKAEAGNALDWFGLIGEGLSGGDIGGGHSNADHIKQQKALAGLQQSIRDGDVPVGDKDKLKAWMDEHAKELPALKDPENMPLLASYLKTRNPAAWEQLGTNLTLNPVQKMGKELVKDAIDSPGAQMLPESMREHLASAADPVNQLMLAAPFLHGAKAVQAVETASKLAQIGKSAAEQAVFGAAQHTRDNPQAGAADTLEAAVEQGLSGALLTTAHIGVAEGLKKTASLLARPQGRTAFIDGQTYYQNPKGEWSQVVSPDHEGNMFAPLDAANTEHAAVIDRLNQRAAASEAPAQEPAPAADTEAPPVAETVELPTDPNAPYMPPAQPAEAPPAAVETPPLDENPVPADQTPPAPGAGDEPAPETPVEPSAEPGAEPDSTPPPAADSDGASAAASEPVEPADPALVEPPIEEPPAQEPPPAAEPETPPPASAEPPPAATPPPLPAGATSTKNAVMEAERAARGADPIVKQAARDWGQAWSDAVATAGKDSAAGMRLVEAINKGDKTALNDQENALLLHEKMRRRGIVRELVKKVNDAPKDTAEGDQAELSMALDDLHKVDEATRAAGRETGRGLNARKMMRDEDDSVENMLATFRAAKGENLSEQEMKHVLKLHGELDTAAKAMDEHTAKNEAAEHQAAQEALAKIQAEVQGEVAARANAARERLKARAERAAQPKELRYRDSTPDRADNVDWDTVDFLRSEGGIARPPKLKVSDMGRVEGDHGEHNALRQFAKDSPHDYAGFANDTGRDIDKLASAAHADNLIDAPTPDALIAKLKEDIATRRSGRDEARTRDKAMAQDERAAMRESRQFEGEQRASERVQTEAGVPLTDQAKNFFQEARKAARSRLNADRGRLHADPLGFQFVRSTIDHTIIGASYLAEGAVDFAKWSGHMIEEFGEAIRPHLEAIFDRSKSMLEQTRKDFADKAAARARAATPEGVYDSVAHRMKMGTLDIWEFDPKIAKEFAKAHVAAGVNDVHELNAKVHADVTRFFPELTPAEVRRAWTDYGQVTKPSSDVLKARMREMKAQAKLVESIERALRGEAPLKGGFQPGKPSPEVMDLTTKLKDTMRKMGIETEGPKQLASAREAVKNRLQNKIDRLHREMEGRAKPRDPREQVQYDAELNGLKKEADELQRYMDDLTGPSSETKWNRQAERSYKASAENYRRMVEQDKLTRPAGKPFEPSERTKNAMAERDAAKAEWDRLRESQGIPQAEALDRLKAGLVKRIGELQERLAGKPAPEPGKPIPLDAEARSLKFEHDRLSDVLREVEKNERPGVSNADRVEAAKKAAERAIEKVEREIAKGEKERSNRPEMVPDAKLRALKAELESLRQVRDEAIAAKTPNRTPAEIALAAYKKRLAAMTEKLQGRLDKGDFSKTERPKLELDKEALALRRTYEDKKLEFARGVEAQRLAKLPLYRKTLDTLVRWRRGFLLSGYHTIEKLAGAAALRLVITPAEEAIGGFYSMLPGFRRIAEAAPREGGFSSKAEVSAVVDGLTHAMEQSWQILKTGKSDLDMKFGGRHFEDLNPSVIDYFGHIHALIKSPAKMAEFHRSLQKRADYLMRRGVDVKDPVIQEIIMKDAYLDANRSIFMQDNFVTKGFEQLMHSWENSKKHDVAGPTAAAFSRILLPIVKVPTNVAFETVGSYALGVPRAAVELAGLLHRGLDNMKPEEADAFMRHLKKGSLGAAMILFGFCNPAMVGGYRQENEKRKPGDVGPGDVKVGDTTISHQLLHTPAMNAMQVGATMARVSDAMIKEHGRSTGVKKGLGTGSLAGALGLLQEVPFFNDTTSIMRFDHEGDYQRHRLAQSVIPLGLKQLAEDTDPVKRQVKTYGDSIKAAVPGLRETLPPAKKQTSHH